MEDRKLVTKFLVDKHIDVVLSSPYKRAIDTVKDFADIHGIEINIIYDCSRKSWNCVKYDY